MILAIDPGPDRSAWLEFDHGLPVAFAHQPNDEVLDRIARTQADVLAIEMVASYGMPVGVETFETCVWAGRLIQRWTDSWGDAPVLRVYRKDVKMHLCGSMRARDPNVRHALLDRFGPSREVAVGRKAAPGPLYGVSGHAWAALAVAVTAADGLGLPPHASLTLDAA